MKGRKGLRLISGLLLCVAGFILARATPFRGSTFLIGASGCRMATDVLDNGNDEVSGFVVLFHGLSANKKIMSYLAEAFAAQNLRVFVPDLPGHGRTPGPFSFSRAETCSESFLRELIERRAIDPARTILAGHSMGGGISERLAAHIPVAGAIAISPAPMSTRHGIARYLLPFENAPPASAKTLVISGSWEPRSVRETARDLISERPATGTSEYVVIPHATHVSLIFDPRVAGVSQAWTAQVLGLGGGAIPASRLPLAGSFIGLAGILLLAGPFIRETLGAMKPERRPEATRDPQKVAIAAEAALQDVSASGPNTIQALFLRAIAETILACSIAVVVLYFWQPLSFVRLFDGAYFCSFLFVVGLALLAIHFRSIADVWSTKMSALLAAALSALLLHFLVTTWFDATLTEAWLTWFRWLRFPVVLVAAFAYLVGEEQLLRRITQSTAVRFVFTLLLRFIAWLTILFAIFVLHRGPILLLLLAPSFMLFCILQLAAMHLVRANTRSLAATALFGAILLAGFCLVIFPVT